MRQIVAALALVAIASPSSAKIIRFMDGFDQDPAQLNVPALSHWDVEGQIDTVDSLNPYGITTCSGICVDLDGSPGPGAIVLRDPLRVVIGPHYFLTFDLTGNQRGGADDVFTLDLIFNKAVDAWISSSSHGCDLGGASGTMSAFSATITLASSDILSCSLSMGFGFPYGKTMQIRFGTTSADNVGPILDNIVFYSVPEPATWAMLIAGFGLVGSSLRRRRPAVA